MADIAVQSLTDVGLAPTYTAASAGGDKIVNAGANQVLIIRNKNASSRTVTLTTTKTVNGLAVADRAVVVAAASGLQERFIGKLDKSVYNIASGEHAGKVSLSYSTEVDLSIAHISLD